MTEIIFNDKTAIPDDILIAKTTGGSHANWINIKNHVNDNYDSITEEWKFYGKNYGWQLKTFFKKRNLYFMIPYYAYFTIVFIFGDKAVSVIEKSNIHAKLKNDIINAKKYGEGRGIAIEVRNAQFIPDIKQLIEIKVNN